jgi:hypothetical protein
LPLPVPVPLSASVTGVSLAEVADGEITGELEETGTAASRLAPLACPCPNALGGAPALFSRLCPRRLANRAPNPLPLPLPLSCAPAMGASTNFGCACAGEEGEEGGVLVEYAEALELVLDNAGEAPSAGLFGGGVGGTEVAAAGASALDVFVRPVEVRTLAKGKTLGMGTTPAAGSAGCAWGRSSFAAESVAVAVGTGSESVCEAERASV